MPLISSVIGYALMAFGGLVVIANAFALLRGLAATSSLAEGSSRNENVVFVVFGALLVALGLFVKSQSMEDWSGHWQGTLGFCVDHKWWLIGVTAISLVSTFLLMGLPGIGVITLLDALIDPLLARPLGWSAPPGGTVWPAALLYAFFTPWLAFFVFLVCEKVFATRTPLLTGALVGILTSVIVAGLHLLYRYSHSQGS